MAERMGSGSGPETARSMGAGSGSKTAAGVLELGLAGGMELSSARVLEVGLAPGAGPARPSGKRQGPWSREEQ